MTGNSATVKTESTVIAAINSSNTVTFYVDWTLAAMSGSLQWSAGIRIQYRTGKYNSSTEEWSYGAWTNQVNPVATNANQWSKKYGSFSVAVANCNRQTNARLQLRMVTQNSATMNSTTATFTPDIVAITLQAGTGIASVTKSPNQSYHIVGDSITAKCSLSSKTGYQTLWKGWTSSNTSGIADSSSQTYSFKASDIDNTTLVANATQTANKYSVVYNGNGATSGSMMPSSHFYDTAQTLNPNTFTRTGYSFKGWSTSSTASFINYSDKQSVKNLTDTNGGTVILYAVWTANTYVLTLQHDVGVSAISGGGNKTYGTNCTATATVRTGYLFVNWISNNASLLLSSASNPYAFKMPAGAITLNANTKPITYNIAYNPNTGDGVMDNTVCTYDINQTVSVNMFKHKGYVFREWNTKADGSGTSYFEGQSIKNLTTINNSTITLYAQWKPVTYTIEYQSNGGTSGQMEPSRHTYNIRQNLTTNAFARNGYIFAGWSTRPTGDVEFNNEDSVINLSDVNGYVFNLYAVWIAKTYTVSFDSQPNTITVDYDQEMPEITPPNREGYFFNGYFSLLGGKGTRYYSNTGSSSHIWDIDISDEITTLYAEWVPITYKIHFEGNNSTSGEMPDITIPYDTQITLPRNAFKKSKYFFTCWKSDNKTFKNGEKIKNLTFTDGKVFTLTAQWKPKNIGYFPFEDPVGSSNYIWKLGFVHYCPTSDEQVLMKLSKKWIPCYANICKQDKWELSGKKEDFG